MDSDIIYLRLDDFSEITACPLCSMRDHVHVGNLKKRTYVNGRLVIVDIDDFSLRKCRSCGLVFRNYVTRPETERKMQSLWFDESKKFHRWRSNRPSGNYRLRKIIDEFSRKIFPSERLRLLDVGVGEGDFIKIFEADYETYGLEKFPIDTVDYKSIVNSGMIFGDLEDSEGIAFTENFNIITALDIFEHLKLPKIAMKSIHSMLVKGGLLLIETGNIDCFVARSPGLHRWWYTAILEHKVFWSPNTISKALENERFRVIRIIRKAHKSGLVARQRLVVKFLFHKVSPKLYYNVLKSLNKNYQHEPELRIPWRDHFLVIAQKVEQ